MLIIKQKPIFFLSAKPNKFKEFILKTQLLSNLNNFSEIKQFLREIKHFILPRCSFNIDLLP